MFKNELEGQANHVEVQREPMATLENIARGVAPEMTMNHANGKESSALQACGYHVKKDISQKDWSEMEARDMRDRIYDEKGYYSYRKDAPIYTGENMHPRYG